MEILTEKWEEKMTFFTPPIHLKTDKKVVASKNKDKTEVEYWNVIRTNTHLFLSESDI